MFTKQKINTHLGIKLLSLAALLAVLSILFIFTPTTNAALGTNKGCEVNTSLIDCTAIGNSVDESGNLQNSGLWSILLLAIQILSTGVGVAALAGIVYGIVLYSLSQGDPGKIKKALEVIRNVVIGVAAYALMWSALNWLIPGGVFN